MKKFQESQTKLELLLAQYNNLPNISPLSDSIGPEAGLDIEAFKNYWMAGDMKRMEAWIDRLIKCPEDDICEEQLVAEGFGDTPITFLAMSDHSDLLKKAVTCSNGAMLLNVSNKFGMTPLNIAVQGDRLESVEILVNAGADLWSVDINGENMLHIAARFSKGYTWKYLIDKGCDLGRNDDQETVLHLLADRPMTGKILECIAVAIKMGCPIDAQDMLGNTALHNAIHAGQYQTSFLLMRLGIDLSLKDNLGLMAEEIYTLPEATKRALETQRKKNRFTLVSKAPCS